MTYISRIIDADLQIINDTSTPGDIQRMVGDDKLLREITNSYFYTDIYDGINKMINKYRQNTYFE